MAGLTVKIKSGDAAFSTDDEARVECVRLLRLIAQRIDDGHDCGGLMDVNGNNCGAWDYEAPETDDEGDES